MVSLSTAESEQDAAVKTASGRRDPACGEGFGHGVCGLNLHLDTSATMCPVNRGGLGKGETRRHAKLVDTGGIQGRKNRHEESGDQCEPR